MKKLFLTSIAALLLATGAAYSESCGTNRSPYCICVMREAHAIVRRQTIHRGTAEVDAALATIHARCARHCPPGRTCGRGQ
jgi:hypothetical protein